MSLHLILVLTVTLLHCHTANTLPFVSDIQRIIGRLEKSVCNEPDSTFYSPSGNNGCTIKALQCSVLELETVAAECFESTSEMTKLVYRTRDSIKLMLKAKQVDFRDCFCGKENPDLKTYKEFLDNLRGLVQMLNSGG